jgi:peroxiredoxin
VIPVGRRARLALVSGVVVMLVIAIAGVGAWSGWFWQRLGASDPLVGSPAPEFAFEAYSGEQVALSDLRGRPVVVNFWASWCVPCRTEMPAFERVYERFRDHGVAFVGLAVQDDPQQARDFLASVRVSYPVGPDRRNEAGARYGLLGLPTTVLIAPDATVVKRWNGPVSEEQLAEALEPLLAQ